MAAAGLWAVLLATAQGAGPPETAWAAGPGYRSAALAPPPSARTGFTLLPGAQTGVFFTNECPQSRTLTNQMLLNGSGAAAGDVDGDGWTDLFFCNLTGPSRLYRNLGGWRFEDITESAGVSCAGFNSTGAVLADVNGDGALDLIVATLGNGTRLFLNNGRGQFTDATQAWGLGGTKGNTSLALGDADGDGFLDLYVANYRVGALSDSPRAYFTFKMVNGRKVIATVDGRPASAPDLVNRFRLNAKGGIDENGEEDDFYHNNGGRGFTRVPFTGGAFLDEEGQPLAQPPFDWGLSVAFRDLNQDGWPDLFVCNDFDAPDRIWINDQHGHFRALPRLALRKSSLFCMAVDFADINRDGWLDFFTLDMLSRHRLWRMTTMPDRKLPLSQPGDLDNRPQYSRNMLFLNRGDGSYAEIGALAGVGAAEWAWGTVFLDVDLDGWEDLLIANGHERDARNLDTAAQLRQLREQNTSLSRAEILAARVRFPRYDTGKLAFRNRRDLTFEDKSADWGFDFFGVSNGITLADLDNDGDLDVIVNNFNQQAAVLRNDTPAPRLAVRLKGRAPNTRGIGAFIRVSGGPVVQTQEMIAGGHYASSMDPVRVFASGALTNRLDIEVLWRSGARSALSNLPPNRLYEIAEPAPEPGARPRSSAPPPPARGPAFEDVSSRIDHSHHEEPFNDMARQPLLPNRLSQLGPGVTWCDLDADGWDDLVAGTGKGGLPGVFINNRKGGFTRASGPPFDTASPRDLTTILPWHKPSGGLSLLAGFASWEDAQTDTSCVRQFDLPARAILDAFPGNESSVGPLAMADGDGDGQLDLFVGGRAVPGRHPQGAASVLFLQRDGKFVVDEPSLAVLGAAGLVSGAVFSDLDGDGAPDLVLACEWGPVRVYHNDRGRFTEITGALGLDAFPGWWNGVAVADFDEDGRLDIAVSNWGRNTRYERDRARPLEGVYGDLDGDGVQDLIEVCYDTELGKRVPQRTFADLAQALPFLQAGFTTCRDYALKSVDEVFGDRLTNSRVLQASCLESTLFLNRGGHFEVRVLPVEAQMAPAFGIAAGDLDGDGHLDLFLAQNFFATTAETPRCDAGRSLWLRGDGRGGFVAVLSRESGLAVDGEQRGCALADFDGDGRLDLCVSQNAGATKLYRNTAARPGLRARLAGPASNPAGVGATLRLAGSLGPGPRVEIQCGSGYWSHDSPVHVLTCAGNPLSLEVRWPGRAPVTLPLPEGAGEIEITPNGAVRKIR